MQDQIQIRQMMGGTVMLIPNVGVAKKLHFRGSRWKVQSRIGAVWDSIYIPGNKTDVKIVESKPEARRLLLELAGK